MLSCKHMNAMLHRLGGWMVGLTIMLAVTGCVEKRMVIFTEPAGAAPGGPDLGAIVYDEKNQPIGASPADKSFTYYGKYHFRIAKDGYETLEVDQRVRAPWYELPGLDFISENLIPWTIRDVRYYRYVMQPLQVRTPEQLLGEARLLREYGKTIGTPLADFIPPTGTVLLPPTP